MQELVARGRRRLFLLPPPRAHNYARHMIAGFAEAAALHQVTFEVATEVTSESAAAEIEAAMRERFKAPNPPDGVLSGSTTGAMASVSGAEQTGRRIGQDFDLVAKEAIRFLHRFRPEIIVVHEDVGRAGDFLARALIAAIERRAPEQGQFLETPTAIDP